MQRYPHRAGVLLWSLSRLCFGEQREPRWFGLESLEVLRCPGANELRGARVSNPDRERAQTQTVLGAPPSRPRSCCSAIRRAVGYEPRLLVRASATAARHSRLQTRCFRRHAGAPASGADDCQRRFVVRTLVPEREPRTPRLTAPRQSNCHGATVTVTSAMGDERRYRAGDPSMSTRHLVVVVKRSSDVGDDLADHVASKRSGDWRSQWGAKPLARRRQHTYCGDDGTIGASLGDGGGRVCRCVSDGRCAGRRGRSGRCRRSKRPGSRSGRRRSRGQSSCRTPPGVRRCGRCRGRACRRSGSGRGRTGAQPRRARAGRLGR